MIAGVDLVHVPYRGSAPMVVDLLSGQVQASIDNMPTSIEHIKAGRLKPLAVTTAARSLILPDVPTVSEFLPDYEASAWSGVGAPRNTPTDIVDKLNREINAGLADPKMMARLAELGSTPMPLSPAEFGASIADETEKWAKMVKFANIKPE